MNKFQWIIIMIGIVLAMSSVSAQDSNTNVALTLQRSACFGTCPVYTVNILEDGTVIYDGENFVSVTGEQTAEIPAETVTSMVDAFANAGYFEWEAAYDTQSVSDLSTVTTSVTRDGISHQIARYTGDYSAPLALPFLEQWIDQMTNTALWTGIQPDISAISNGTDTPLITLDRGPQFGPGPVYTIAAYEDGTVVYTGIAHVHDIGVHVFQTATATIANIAETGQILGYFGWQDHYEERIITDQATISTSLRWDEQFKRIVRYDGDPNAPIGIVRIEDRINSLVTDFVG